MEDKMRSNNNIIKAAVAFLVAAMLLSMCACSTVNTEETRSVRTVEVNEKGELVVIFSDGTSSVMGTVKGEDGKDGIDGKDGKDGADGKDGKDGAQGPEGEEGKQGIMGPDGKNGRSIDRVYMNENGGLTLVYSDGKTEEIDLLGSLYLFGGKCGDEASWALYNGGILIIGGKGSATDYGEGGAPWYPIRSMLSVVYVDRSQGLELNDSLLFGIDESIVTYSSATSIKWVDMTVEAPVFATADNTTEPIGKLPLGEEIGVIAEEGEYTKIEYGMREAYIETKYTVSNNGSVVYDLADFRVTVSRDTGANLRTFPDATDASSGHTYANVPFGTILNCTGVSKNGNWYRISYDGQILYAYKTWVTKS